MDGSLLMKKIDKSSRLSSKYHKWISKGVKIPKEYYSSHKYYKDIIVNLLHCQGGICAYTECRLIDEKKLKQILTYFDKGKYTGPTPIQPDIEHFCSIVKEKKPWVWANLFVVHLYINRDIKRVREAKLIKETGKGVKGFLKPDHKNYSPFDYLEYDYDEHRFDPLFDLDDDLAQDVINMIDVLGLNNDYILMLRREYISTQIENLIDGKNVKINQFYTSYKMAKTKLSLT